MRILLVALLAIAGCGGGKGQVSFISCGASASLCNVTDGHVCCVSSTAATCTTTCSGMPRFDCLGPTTCPNGVCCVDDLGGHCVSACDSTQSHACEQDADCAATGGKCNQTKSYSSASGAQLFFVQYCGGTP